MILEQRETMLSALRESDLYVLNSTSEGFGLVLLESMLNGTPWIARNIAGAETMREFGKTYSTQEELEKYLREFAGESQTLIKSGQQYVIAAHQITHTIDDILRAIK
jgi:glycosyltransferase involved in cell wall biosynthesis